MKPKHTAAAIVLTLFAILASLYLTGCETLQGKVRLKVCRDVGGTQVCAESDFKTVTITAGDAAK